MSVTLETLNHLPEDRFVAHLDGLYEHSPWIVRAIAAQRPFASGDALIEAAQAHVRQASGRQQLDLICAHPELGSRQLARLTPASQAEQRGAGLAEDQERLERLRTLNEAYRRRHGFPFVIAVTGLSPEVIVSTLEVRLPRDSDTEVSESLTQIGHIARQRLHALLDTDQPHSND
ncbi:2-oxo-4-hydroxy-4-carboxy-5-ureidoimidazoline decarboxylase [Kushneria avicenniae]|uniref:2-oxo-4-hydroxy-4-carboxy-5-ureidoimidazoline decarboxylase n=1 Tax=Kushneria avicenniae TaxID=402385 RepID=A0A1I1LZ95_9GAMM|nr:2-oxo-4-hydroxy-4-carboxy-5-ureidoimidazoline decarboxylase [Kushneria avicenniae]SFC75653.1 2-oxo-4-hydroxy-4-carboxy-5-ureidoimidazoline decarboxylase [Kushneria avicenniae]